jgi:hypothetical protein
VRRWVGPVLTCIAGAGLVGVAASLAVGASPGPLPPELRSVPGLSCHARRAAGDWLPDPVCTPGAVNPRVTQANIGTTICKPRWATLERARYFPLSRSEPTKRRLVRTYGEYAGPSLRGYELDHEVPLSSGGSPDDERNLWPESPATPNAKDKVEAAANRAICSGRMTLAHVQAGFEKDWRELAGELGADSGG